MELNSKPADRTVLATIFGKDHLGMDRASLIDLVTAIKHCKKRANHGWRLFYQDKYTFLSKRAPKKWFILRGNWVPQITDFIHLFVKFGILHREKIAYFEEKERTHEKPLIRKGFYLFATEPFSLGFH